MSSRRALFAGIVLGCAVKAAGANGLAMPVITTTPAASPSPNLLPPAGSAPRITLLPSPSLPSVDHVVVRKAQRRLYLMDGDKVVRAYKVALGL
jgi:hypothetical protein